MQKEGKGELIVPELDHSGYFWYMPDKYWNDAPRTPLP